MGDYSTTEIYRQAFHYAEGISTDIRLFAGAMLIIMRDRVWESGWTDQVSGETISTPSLRTFIERRVPKGIGQSIEWTYATLKTANELKEEYAKDALELLNEQIKEQEGETAEAIYLRTVADASPELAKAMEPRESGAKGGRGKKASYNIRAFKGSEGTSVGYTLARLKRDFPELAKRVVSGELSANAAAIKAGFRKKLSPFEQAERLIPKLTDDELDNLHRLISTTIIERGKLATRFKKVGG